MIDIHAHLIPGIDDGARNRDESLAMLRIAAEDGVRTIVATPHNRKMDPGLPIVTGAALRVLRKYAEEERIPIQVLGGFELSLTPHLSELAEELRILGLNGSRYLLVETPEPFWPAYIETQLFELQARGLRPILAHAERYHALQDDLELASVIAKRDVLLQVNASSLTGCNGPKQQQLARELVRRGLVSFIASDAHSPRNRTPIMQKGVRAAARLVGSEAAEAMVQGNPRAALTDCEIPPAPPFRRFRIFSIPRRQVRARSGPRVVPEHPSMIGSRLLGHETGGSS